MVADVAEVAIEEGLLTQARAFASSVNLTLAEPNRDFTPPLPTPTAKYLRASFMPAPSFALGIAYDAHQQHYGIFQLDVFCGIRGSDIEPRRIAADVAAYFKRGTTIIDDDFVVTLYESPQVVQGFSDGSWWIIPVRLLYRCYARPTT
jgi:hypothetical protein